MDDTINYTEIAESVGTPCYVYSLPVILGASQSWKWAFSEPHEICYSVKANSNLSILKTLGDIGIGFDIVSAGELRRVKKAGCDTSKVRFSGCGKTDYDLRDACLENIASINIESVQELTRLLSQTVYSTDRTKVSVRVNPEIEAGAFAQISTACAGSKFGVSLDEFEDLCLAISKDDRLYLRGCTFHLGSQISDPEVYARAIKTLLPYIERLRKKGLAMDELDIGGGTAVVGDGVSPISPHELSKAVLPLAKEHNLKLVVSPGRSLVGPSGVLLTKVLYNKRGTLIVDAGMNDYLRPALYRKDAEIQVVEPNDANKLKNYSVAGPVCESTDYFTQDCSLRVSEDGGDLLAIQSAGAYGMSMASCYNSRGRCAEVLATRKDWLVVSRTYRYEELLQSQMLVIPDLKRLHRSYP